MFDVFDGVPNKKDALARGKLMVRDGKPRREVAIEIYDEYYFDNNVQEDTKSRRIRELVRLLT